MGSDMVVLLLFVCRITIGKNPDIVLGETTIATCPQEGKQLPKTIALSEIASLFKSGSSPDFEQNQGSDIPAR